MITSFIFGFALFDIDTSSVTERQYSLTLVVPWGGGNVLVESEAFLPHLYKFAFDLFEVRAESNDFLQPRQTSNVKQIGLVVDKKVSHFIGFFVLIFAKENSYPII